MFRQISNLMTVYALLFLLTVMYARYDAASFPHQFWYVHLHPKKIGNSSVEIRVATRAERKNESLNEQNMVKEITHMTECMRSIVYNNPFRQEIVDEWEKQARASLVGSLSHNLIIFDRSLRSYKDITPVVVTSHADLSEPIEMHNVQHLHVQPVDWQPWAYGAYVFGNAFLFIRRCGNFEEPCRLSQDRLNERGELQQHIFWRHMEQIVDEVTHGLLKKDMQESFEETRNAPFSYFPRDPWEDPVLWARWDQLFPDVPKNDEEHAWRRTLMLNTYLRSQSLTEAMERRAEHVLEGAADFWDDESEEHQAMYYHLARPSRLKPKRKTVD